MKRRIPIISAIVVAVMALFFLLRWPAELTVSRSAPANGETAADDESRRPKGSNNTEHQPSAGNDLQGAFALPGKGTPADQPASGLDPQANPPPASIPMVTGGRTFIPKAPPPQTEPQATVELDKVRLMLRDYRTLYRENPVGTNAEIMKAVMGGNPKQAQLGPPDGQQLSGNGELLDRWGTPYFFHQLSKDSMEVRSAGPDKTLWTSDDILTK